MRGLESLSPPDPNNPDESGSDVFLRGSTPSPIPESIPPPEREYTIAVWVLSALLVILSAVLVFVVVHILYNHRLRTLTLFPRRRLKAIQERIERRYETIEGWIISKRVQEHDEFCETCVRDFSTFNEEEWIKKNTTMDTTQDSQLGGDSNSADGSNNAHIMIQTTPNRDDALEMESAQAGEKECTLCSGFCFV